MQRAGVTEEEEEECKDGEMEADDLLRLPRMGAVPEGDEGDIL